MERIKLLLTLDLDPETGETKCVDRQIINDDLPKKTSTKKSSKKPKDDNPTPTISLEDNKYTLNNAAVELMGVQPDDRIDVKFEKNGKLIIPVIGTNEVFKTKGGNRLTKSFTVSCRGKLNEELSKYGDSFTLEPHPSTPGLFLLLGNKDYTPSTSGDENINIEEKDEDLPTDLGIDDLTEEDSENKEITDFDFSL